MNKEEFLTKLKKRLDILEDSEIEDIATEYESYVDEKVANGKTEEEAVKELGDFDEIINDLLAAYKVKVPQKEENGFTKFINKISKGIDFFIDSLNDKSAKDIIKILIEIVIILFLIWLFKIPFVIIKEFGSELLLELAHPIGNIFRNIWCFLIDLSYIIVAIVFFVKIFEKRYFKNFADQFVEGEFEEEPKKEKRNEIHEEKNVRLKKEKREKENQHSFIDSITDLCILFLKFIVILILIGIIFYLIGVSVAIGIMVYLIFKGVQYYGVLIFIIALFLAGAFFLELGINFCFNKRIQAFPFFSKLITIIIITGIGLTWSAIEITNTDIIYENYYKDTKSIVKEIPMTNDMSFYNYDAIVVDNTLENTVKIEYVYPDFQDNLKVDILLHRCGKGYCLNTNIQNLKWNKDFINTVIQNLKDKKIYTYDFYVKKTIYVNEENYRKILNNHQYYNHQETYTFTRTYNVTSVVEDNSNLYLYLTIYQYQIPEEIATVRVSKALARNVASGGIYEFTFQFHDDEPDDTIEDIFEECKLIDIQATDKRGLDQIQDVIPTI